MDVSVTLVLILANQLSISSETLQFQAHFRDELPSAKEFIKFHKRLSGGFANFWFANCAERNVIPLIAKVQTMFSLPR